MFSKKNSLNTLLLILTLFLVINSLFNYPYQPWIQFIGTIGALLLIYRFTFSKTKEIKKESDDFSIEKTNLNFVEFIEGINWPLCIMTQGGQLVYTNNAFKQFQLQKTDSLNGLDVEMRTILQDALNLNSNEKKIVYYDLKVYELSSNVLTRKYTLIMFNDITARATEQRNSRRFLADASHELKTPITAIKGSVEVLLNNQEQDVDIIYEFLEQIHVESNRMQQIVEDMLSISKLSSRTVLINKKTFDLSELVNEVRKTFKDEFSSKGMLLKVKTEPLKMFADREKIQSILVNLVSNALRYSTEGTVEIDYYIEDNEIVITIKDDGFGIEAKNIPRIFDRFYRVETDRNRKIGGSGLGLSITHQLVTEHGGTIDVQSEVDVGTTFICRFPTLT